jgi:hypothetical protein
MVGSVIKVNLTWFVVRSMKFTALSKLVTNVVSPSGVIAICSGRETTGMDVFIWNAQVEIRVTSACVWTVWITSGNDESHSGGFADAGTGGKKGKSRNCGGKAVPEPAARARRTDWLLRRAAIGYGESSEFWHGGEAECLQSYLLGSTLPTSAGFLRKNWRVAQKPNPGREPAQ